MIYKSGSIFEICHNDIIFTILLHFIIFYVVCTIFDNISIMLLCFVIISWYYVMFYSGFTIFYIFLYSARFVHSYIITNYIINIQMKFYKKCIYEAQYLGLCVSTHNTEITLTNSYFHVMRIYNL